MDTSVQRTQPDRTADKDGARRVVPGSVPVTNERDGGHAVSAPALSLPKSGGAIRGLGEKFATNPVTGTGSLTVPLPLSQGRSGFGPKLTLSYDTGASNGPFGFGWGIGLPAISRKTDKGLPRYRGGAESDVFLLSGAEDLVPIGDMPGGGRGDAAYRIELFRPRIEGLFARIERWTRRPDGDVHWRSVTRDNVTTLYGKDAESRIADPDDPTRVFTWLICSSQDDKGNLIGYRYMSEDSVGLDASTAHEGNRTSAGRAAGRYLDRIHYGNRSPHRSDWMFEVVFDYGDQPRADPFSSYRAGFEIRGYRLCRQVRMVHHFPDEPDVGQDCLVRSLDLSYREDAAGSFLTSVTSTGYRRTGDGYARRALPPLEFRYSAARLGNEVQELDSEAQANLPAGLTSGYHWTDLDGEGISGVLTDQAGGWFYRPNLGDGRFGQVEAVAPRPISANLARQQLLDLAGDGRLELVDFAGPTPGYFERTPDRNWGDFNAFNSLPRIAWDDPNLRFADLSGDGLADVLITTGELIRWYPSLGESGFGPAAETTGPELVFADGEQSIYLADLSGDGLTDLVRIRNGSVCYWPNLGYGRFGAKVVMDNAPWFDTAELFDQKRLRLVDVDGTGPTDLIYLGPGGVRLYPNQSGNRWGEPQVVKGFPPVDNVAAVSVLDLLGTGTACLVWSSPLPGDTGRAVRYLDLMADGKPNLLVESRNNLGAKTTVEYVSSTRFYLDGKAAGRPWITKLAFPVQVIARVTSYDEISGNVFSSRYAYHDGYFDGFEREFRGFGMVEQTDTEDLAALRPDASNVDEESYLPPVLTRTWHHTGAESYAELFEQSLPDGLSTEEHREACRALKGSLLRQEVYALDGSDQEHLPYTISERSYTVKRLAPRIFLVHGRETQTFHYERELDDPRISRELTLEVDDFGNVLRAMSVGLGRSARGIDIDPRLPTELREAIHREQSQTHSVLTENDYTNAIDTPAAYRLPVLAEARTYEVTDAHRLIERVRTLYLRDDLSGPLPLGEQDPLGLTFEAYQLAFPTGMLEELYGDRVAPLMLLEAGYRQIDGSWWVPSGRSIPDPGHFHLPTTYRDPFGNETTVAYDPYDLLVSSTRDALGHEVQVSNDYRVLQPKLLIDSNGNRTAVAFDTLGLLAGTAVMGKEGERVGDRLDGFLPDLDPEVVASYLADPLAHSHELLREATSRVIYDVHAFWRDGAPPVAASLTRETHAADGEVTRIQHGLSYSDGFGREIQRKIQAEPGLDGVPRWVGSGWTVFNNKGKPVRKYEPFFTGSHLFEFARVNGVSPILFYDPIERVVATLLPHHAYEKVDFDPWRQLTWDANDTVLLDPRNESFTSRYVDMLADWQTWYARRIDGTLGPAERDAALKAAAHAGTPTVTYADSLGRPIAVVVDNASELITTRTVLDIEGNQREVVDALGRTVVRYEYDLLSHRVSQHSMEAGARWQLNDVTGKPLYAWDSKGFQRRSEYDELRRPIATYVGSTQDAKTVYGTDAALNNRTRVVQHFDASGVVTNEDYDFKGNLLRGSRRLAANYSGPVDLSVLEPQTFHSGMQYDALNRVTELRTPDGSVTIPAYNEAGLLETVSVDGIEFVADIEYNERGQRASIAYGNGIRTTQEFDPLTFRLTRLVTPGLQELQYTYDPTGNITRIRDDAQQTVYFGNQVVEPSNDYTYDAAYRLMAALGREHLAGEPPSAADAVRTGRPHPGDGQAMGRYTQRYLYDLVGNMLQMSHEGTDLADAGWTRLFRYAEPSLLAPEDASNRLSGVKLRNDLTEQSFDYDEHGNMLAMPEVGTLTWDYRDRLHSTTRQSVHNGGTPETTYYVYDASGQRIRKVTERYAADGQTPARRAERIYLGGFELYREYAGDGTTVTLERETLHVLDGEKRVALVETRTIGDDPGPARLLRYQLANHLGSSALELDERGFIISYEEYYPYGSTSYQAARNRTETPKRYRYTGKERDSETGLYYHGARYYAPWLARWTACDPAGMVDGPNLYQYVRSNPIRLIDPKGTTGLIFTPDVQSFQGIAPTSDKLKTAGKAMATTMQQDLRQYFGIPTTVQDTGSSIRLDLLPKDSPEWAKAHQAAEAPIKEGTRFYISENEMHQSSDEGLANWNVARGRLIKFLEKDADVKLTTVTEGGSLSLPRKPLLSWEIGQGNLRVNPFTWNVNKDRELVPAMTFSGERARTAFSSALNFLHEIGHRLGPMFAQTVKDTTEDGITGDVDKAVKDHPYIGLRGKYKGEVGMRTYIDTDQPRDDPIFFGQRTPEELKVTLKLRERGMLFKPTSIAAGSSWVEFPNVAQLLSGGW